MNEITLTKVAVKNLRRKAIRSLVILIAAALAGGLLFGATTVLLSLEKSLEVGIQRLGADIMVVPAESESLGRKVLLAGEPTAFYMDGKNLDVIKSISGVKQASPQIFIVSTVLACCGLPKTLLVGYDPATDFTIQPWKDFDVQAQGSWIGYDPVLVGYSLSYAGHKQMRFYGKQFRIGALLQKTGLGYFDSTVFMTIDEARDMIVSSQGESALLRLDIEPDQISDVLVKVDDPQHMHKVAADIEKVLPGVTSIVTRDFVSAVRKDVGWTLWGVFAVGAICWVMLLVLMGLVYAMTVNERGRELGILRAMGATRLHVSRLIISEAAMLAGAGGIIGVVVSWIAIVNFKTLIIESLGNIHFLWPSQLFIGTIGAACVGLMLLTGAAAAIYPALRSCLREPYESIHQGM